MGRVFRMECDQCDYYTEEDEPKDWIRIQDYCYSDEVFNTWYFCSWECISEFAQEVSEKLKKSKDAQLSNSLQEIFAKFFRGENNANS